MTRLRDRRPRGGSGFALVLLLSLHAAVAGAQRDARRGGEFDERGGAYEERYEEERRDQQPEQRQWQGAADDDTTRRGDTVDTDTTTDGNTTTRDTTVEGEDDQTVTHDGAWERGGDGAEYRGDTTTSTGRDSDAAAEGVKTDDGFAARGAAIGDRGAAAGEVVKSGDQLEGRSVATDGDTVTRNAVDCDHGDCARTSLTTQPAAAPYGPAAPYFVPYNSYPCPGGWDMVPSVSGDIVYNCGQTPIVTTTLPLTTDVAAAGVSPAGSASLTTSSVVLYQVTPDAAVYATSYAPQGVYCKDVAGRCYWIPGVAAASPDVASLLDDAAGMAQPTANATVITYNVGGNLVYFTGQSPFGNVYRMPVDGLQAWMPGVLQPTDAQRAAIATSATLHRQQGARALAAAARGR